MTAFKRWLRRTGILVILFTSVFNSAKFPLVAAYTQADLNSIIGQTAFYDPNDIAQCGTSSATGTATVLGNSSSVWNSGLQPPYTLEQFAIETLKDIGKKTGTADDSTVTREHVVALLAFMFGEGGDINNSDLFNPLNTGLNAPELLASANNASGVQSFKSFDAGVEATARVMLASYQNRLGSSLIIKDSTAQQFMYTLTYFDKYAGNKAWAEASLPPNADTYYQQRLRLVDQVNARYADIGGLVIGTPDFEQIKNITDKSKLLFAPAGSSTTGGATTPAVNCSSTTDGGVTGVVAGDVVRTALNFAWDTKNHGKERSDAKPTYQVAMPQYNGSTGSYEFSDCGVFTSTVMIASGADTSYPKRGTGVQKPYLDNSPKYKKLGIVSSTAQLQPGDILISSSHTYMYVGLQPGGYNSVAASLSDHVPQADNFYSDGFSGYRLNSSAPQTTIKAAL